MFIIVTSHGWHSVLSHWQLYFLTAWSGFHNTKYHSFYLLVHCEEKCILHRWFPLSQRTSKTKTMPMSRYYHYMHTINTPPNFHDIHYIPHVGQYLKKNTKWLLCAVFKQYCLITTLCAWHPKIMSSSCACNYGLYQALRIISESHHRRIKTVKQFILQYIC